MDRVKVLVCTICSDKVANLIQDRCKGCYQRYQRGPNFKRSTAMRIYKPRPRRSLEEYLYLKKEGLTDSYIAFALDVKEQSLKDMIKRWKRAGWLDD